MKTDFTTTFDRTKASDDNPNQLWVAQDDVAIIIEDTYEGQGVLYYHHEWVKNQISWHKTIGQLIFWSIVFGMIMCALIYFDDNCPVCAAEKPYTVVYEDDCYVDEEYSTEVLGANKVKQMLNERYLK